MNQISRLHLNWKLQFSNYYQVAGVVTMETSLEFLTLDTIFTMNTISLQHAVLILKPLF